MKITAINNINRNIQYKNNNYNSVSVKYESTKNLTKDEFIHKSVKIHNPKHTYILLLKHIFVT